jgi:hypothetical protein
MGKKTCARGDLSLATTAGTIAAATPIDVGGSTELRLIRMRLIPQLMGPTIES